MRLLHGHELAKAILKLLDKEDGVRCAVAFWGPEMARRAQERGATVILDLSMGRTTRNALSELGVTPAPMSAATGERVRVLDRLHAKLYLGRDVAVIGSANASGNALGRDGGAPALWEAGILIRREKEPRAYGKAEDLWVSFLNASRPIRPEDLDRAPLVAVTAAARDNDGNAPSTSILTAVHRDPSDFVSTTFIFGDHDISKASLDIVEGDYTDMQGETPQSHGRSLVCSCSANDPHDVLLRPTLRVLMFWFGRQPGIYAYHDLVRIEHDGRVSFFGRMSWPVVGPAVGLPGISKKNAWKADRDCAERMAEIENQDDGGRFVVMSAQATSAWLEREGRR